MPAGIQEPALNNIQKLFSGEDTKFVVPMYQRSFAWTLDEVEELWEDIADATRRGTEYFLGTAVLKQKDATTFEIIDGQQRLACVSMILSAVRNIYKAHHDKLEDRIYQGFLSARDYSPTDSNPPRGKLQLNRLNDQVYEEFVVKSRDLDEVRAKLRDKKLHPSNKGLLEAYEYFLSRVIDGVLPKGDRYTEFLQPLFNCVRRDVKLIIIPVTNDEDANVYFESLNARGKELAISDLIKNRLYHETKGDVDKAQRYWEDMEDELGKHSLPIPEYVRHFWIAKRATEANFLVREKKLYRAVVKEAQDRPQDAIKLLEDLRDGARDYVKIGDYSGWPDNQSYDEAFRITLEDLKMYRVSQCYPLLLNAIQCFKAAKEVARTFRIVANFSFRYFIIGNQSPGNLERESSRIAFGIRTGTYSNSRQVGDALRSLSSDTSFRDDFSRVSFPKTKSRNARHVLGRIDDFIRANAEGGLETTTDDKRLTLEHVYPENAKPAWRGDFTPGTDPGDYLYRLGNLTLLTKSRNSDAGNESFKKKQAIISSSKLPINRYFTKLAKWSDIEIDARQEQLAKYAVEIWRL